MPSINRVQEADVVYEAITANVRGGRMVIPNATATTTGAQGATEAGDAALNSIGVAYKDAVTVANRAAQENTTTSAPGSFPVTDFTVPDCTFTAGRSGYYPVVFTAVAVAYGVKLACAASGAVRAWVSGDTAAAIIGECAQKGGVSSAGGVGIALIY